MRNQKEHRTGKFPEEELFIGCFNGRSGVNEVKEKLLVIGFNSRPIVASAVKLGYEVICIDYWGDVDLRRMCEEVISPVSQIPGQSIQQPGMNMTFFLSAVKKVAKQHEDVKFALLGSGFDDHPQFWEEVRRFFPVLGNPTGTLEKARSRRAFFQLLSREGIKHPRSVIVHNHSAMLDAIRDLHYPIVLKPVRGEQKTFVQSKQDIPDEMSGEVVVQEFIPGKDASASFIADGSNMNLISVNTQLIGTEWLNAPSGFTYAGNITPLRVEDDVKDRIREIIRILVQDLELVGSNGVDFVLAGSTPYVVEINPRFQATLEIVEMAFDINLLDLHVQACRKRMEQINAKAKKYAARGVLFSPSKMEIPDLTNLSFTKDLFKPKVIVEEACPICSVISSGKDEQRTKTRLKEFSKKVLERCKPVTESPRR